MRLSTVQSLELILLSILLYMEKVFRDCKETDVELSKGIFLVRFRETNKVV